MGRDRLQKIMARAGVASRRRSEEIIEQGRVRVNGKVVAALGAKADPDIDEITVDGRPLVKEPKVHYLLHKPTGYVSTAQDPQGRPTVVQLISGDRNGRLYPVGRLDMDTSGLLLLTNDGDLTYMLTHPKHEIPKTYVAWVEGRPDGLAVRRLRDGIELEDGLTAPARVKSLGYDDDVRAEVLELTIHEGRNRQVRRMLDTVGHPVVKLLRSRIGFLTLTGLLEGEYRRLKPSEVKRLRRLASGERGGENG